MANRELISGKKTWKMDLDKPVGISVLWFGTVDRNGVSNIIGNHSHPFYELHFVLSGEVCYECEGEMVTIRGGEALLLPPYASHRFCKKDGPFYMAYLAFSLKQDAVSILQLPATKSLFSFHTDVKQALKSISTLEKTDDIFTPVFIGNCILEILHSACISLQMQLPPMPQPEEDPRLLDAKQFIEQKKNCRITCEDVAKECGISRKQLSRIFKKHMGKTLNEYLLEVQLTYAEKLVLEGKYSIKEIGFMLGFDNVSGFGIYFKRYFGLPPKLYREQFFGNSTNYID